MDASNQHRDDEGNCDAEDICVIDCVDVWGADAGFGSLGVWLGEYV